MGTDGKYRWFKILWEVLSSKHEKDSERNALHF